MMKWVINSYHGNTDWIYEYTNDVVFYDKKDNNVGSNILDYLTYIVDNYNDLPTRVLFGKSNMLDRHITKEEFDTLLKQPSVNLVPLLTQNHKVYDPTCYYSNGLYYERNDSWYVNDHPHKHYTNYNDFARVFDLPTPEYLGFAPGACWIVPAWSIRKRTKEYYKKLIELINYDANPAEAHMIERALYYIWR